MSDRGREGIRYGARWGAFGWVLAVLVALTIYSGCSRQRAGAAEGITLYSGRSADLIQPLIDRFTEATGIPVRVRYGGTAELAATILEEGQNSPADVFLAQDAGALGALAKAGRFTPLPPDLLKQVPAPFRSPDGLWVGVSGRARVVVYNPNRVRPEELPNDLADLCAPAWAGRVGWAPMNASFQAHVTALRVTLGEAATRTWLLGMQANRPRVYARNTAIVAAVAAGEIDAGLVNHYYLHTMQREQGGRLPAVNHTPARGALVNVAGAGLLRTARQPAPAERFIRYLLAAEAQRYFTDSTFEYPVVPAIATNPELPALDLAPLPDLDLSRLEDLDGTLKLLQDLGIL